MKRSDSCHKTRQGFTLIELVCVLAVGSILLIALTAVLQNSILVMNELEKADENYLNGSFAIDYVAQEVAAAEAVYSLDDTSVSVNLGFASGFILKMNDIKYITYALRGSSLNRYKTGNLHGFADSSTVQGTNLLAGDVESIDSTIDKEKGVLTVRLTVKKDESLMTFNRVLEIPLMEVIP